MTIPETTLRERLRSGTRAAHDGADAVFGRFDLTRPDGLRPFLAAHRDAFGRLREATPDTDGDDLAEMLDIALEDIGRDLDALGAPPRPAPVQPAPEDDDPLARRYIWLGSRLGTRMLARRWREASDLEVRQAGRYLSAVPASGPWRTLCSTLEDMSARGTRAERVLAASNGWFAVFEAAGLHHLRAARDGG